MNPASFGVITWALRFIAALSSCKPGDIRVNDLVPILIESPIFNSPISLSGSILPIPRIFRSPPDREKAYTRPVASLRTISSSPVMLVANAVYISNLTKI